MKQRQGSPVCRVSECIPAHTRYVVCNAIMGLICDVHDYQLKLEKTVQDSVSIQCSTVLSVGLMLHRVQLQLRLRKILSFNWQTVCLCSGNYKEVNKNKNKNRNRN